MPVSIRIPKALHFDALQINLTEEGVQFDLSVIEALCAANGLNAADIAAEPPKLVALIAAWYTRERLNGGDRRPAVERLVCGTGAATDDFVVR